jgi:mannose-6-phosphate isomerase-like protein (cupin superfamily)
MRCVQGDGYELLYFPDLWCQRMRVGPGLFMPFNNGFTLNGVEVPCGSGAEFSGPVVIHGTGACALALESDPVETDEPADIAVNELLVHDKHWGWEHEVVTTRQRLQLKQLMVHSGHRTSLQYHNHKDECVIWLVGPSEPVHIPPGTRHRVEGYRLYVEASTYHPNDVVRVEDDYGRAS